MGIRKRFYLNYVFDLYEPATEQGSPSALILSDLFSFDFKVVHTWSFFIFFTFTQVNCKIDRFIGPHLLIHQRKTFYTVIGLVGNGLAIR